MNKVNFKRKPETQQTFEVGDMFEINGELCILTAMEYKNESILTLVSVADGYTYEPIENTYSHDKIPSKAIEEILPNIPYKPLGECTLTIEVNDD